MKVLRRQPGKGRALPPQAEAALQRGEGEAPRK
jgi:hypothetical protein